MVSSCQLGRTFRGLSTKLFLYKQAVSLAYSHIEKHTIQDHTLCKTSASLKGDRLIRFSLLFLSQELYISTFTIFKKLVLLEGIVEFKSPGEYILDRTLS